MPLSGCSGAMLYISWFLTAGFVTTDQYDHPGIQHQPNIQRLFESEELSSKSRKKYDPQDTIKCGLGI